MRILHRVYKQIVSYKLGYSPQRPYPWRWTTPVSLSVFLLLASVLAVINVPLSAYELNQESTFHPNDTLSPLPFYHLIPKILQHPTDSFTPQILTIGDTIKLNRSLFEYTIFGAFDRSDKPTQRPSAFSYYNNPFSDGCDIVTTDYRLSHSLLLIHVQVRMSADITLDSEDQQVQLTVVVSCRKPTLFTLTWTGIESRSSQIFPPTTNFAFNDLRNFAYNLRTGLASWYQSPLTPASTGRGHLTLFFQDRLEMRLYIQPNHHAALFQWFSNKSHWNSLASLLHLTQSTEKLLRSIAPESICLAPNTPMADLGTLLENIFQSIYHVVRLDLGVVLNNQIYLFPEMYNRSILPVHDPNAVFRSSMSKAAFTARWLDLVRDYTQTDRVPVMPYLRPVPRLKPRASALTSVFVSTFAMLSVLWTIFNVIVGAFVPSRTENADTQREEVTEQSESGSHLVRDLENQTVGVELEELSSSKASVYMLDPLPKESLLAMLEHLSAKSDRMERSLQRVILSLERHGILEHVEEAGTAMEHALEDALSH
ncbi:hypothetical protein B0H14DRAFT_3884955 [Mycena olivaceomarginata]|nr:hypothetical protein B0H14DRAFT_3884955 [Mycena olivaceomarginata]